MGLIPWPLGQELPHATDAAKKKKKKKNVEGVSKVQSGGQTGSNWYYSHDRITMQNTETRAYCTAQETLLGIL